MKDLIGNAPASTITTWYAYSDASYLRSVLEVMSSLVQYVIDTRQTANVGYDLCGHCGSAARLSGNHKRVQIRNVKPIF